MPAIKPFKAVYYNPQKVANLSDAVCPPYDVISREQQEDFYKQSPFNFIRLELTKEAPKDEENAKYGRAKKTYDEWLRKGILIEDDKPAVYFYKQDYKYQGRKCTRTGFIALMRIAEDSGTKILPHENTHAAAKADRFLLWSALKSNLSSIFVCFADQTNKVDKIFIKDVAPNKPLMEAVDADKVKHTLWRLDDPDKINQIMNVLEGQNLFIADGHHRFEVANQIRCEALKTKTRPAAREPYNYVMTYFTNLDSKDLQIFPIHRIVRKFPANQELLEQYFRIDRIKTKSDLSVLLGRAGQNEHAFGLIDKGGMRLSRLKNKTLIDTMVTEGSSDYRNLDSAILKALILDPAGVAGEDIIYSKDPDEVVAAVNNGEAEAGFILNAVPIKQLKAVALNGEKMPPKTTYFYPKVLSGLTVYKME